MAAKRCSVCGEDLSRAAFSKKQWKNGDARKCKECTAGQSATKEASLALELERTRTQLKDLGHAATLDLHELKAENDAHIADRRAADARHRALKEHILELQGAVLPNAADVDARALVEQLRESELRARVECDAVKEELADAEDRLAARAATSSEIGVLEEHLTSESAQMAEALVALAEREKAALPAAPSELMLASQSAELIEARAELAALTSSSQRASDAVALHKAMATQHQSRVKQAVVKLNASRAKRAVTKKRLAAVEAERDALRALAEARGVASSDAPGGDAPSSTNEVEARHAEELLHNARMLETLQAKLDDSEARCRRLEAAARSSAAARALASSDGSGSWRDAGALLVAERAGPAESLRAMQAGLRTMAELKASQASVGRLVAKLDALMPQ